MPDPAPLRIGTRRIGTAGSASRHIGRYADHGRWMVRSFSLCFAGVMLRLLVLTYEQLVGAGLVDFSFKTAYIGIAWLCWVPNLLVALFVVIENAENAASAA